MAAYAEGERAAGDKALHEAAAENSPQQLHAFAVALRPLIEHTGGRTGDRMQAAVETLTYPKPREAQAAGHGHEEKEKPLHVELAAAKEPAPASAPAPELRSGTELPAKAGHAMACLGGECTAAKVATGPLVITNAYSGGGCPDEVFLAAGHLDKPHWLLMRSVRAPLNVVGQFVLEDGEELWAGVRTTEKSPKDDPKCAVTWSGFRPATSAHPHSAPVPAAHAEVAEAAPAHTHAEAVAAHPHVAAPAAHAEVAEE